MITYFDIEACVAEIFPLIHRELTVDESAADYEWEAHGMAELKKVLSFMQEDGYYPTWADKASYLLCSIAGSQYFSNGNKRLSIMALMKFLGINTIAIPQHASAEYQSILGKYFPAYSWEENKNIHDAHALLLYNLAIVIGDRTRWGGMSFADVKENVATMFRALYR